MLRASGVRRGQGSASFYGRANKEGGTLPGKHPQDCGRRRTKAASVIETKERGDMSTLAEKKSDWKDWASVPRLRACSNTRTGD